MDNSLQPNFAIGNMADELMLLTLELCGRKEDKNPRFPKYLYDSFVPFIIKTAAAIQEDVFVANTHPKGNTDRVRMIIDASGKCVYLNHLVRIVYERGWISDKQRDRWQGLTTNLHWKIRNWAKSE